MRSILYKCSAYIYFIVFLNKKYVEVKVIADRGSSAVSFPKKSQFSSVKFSKEKTWLKIIQPSHKSSLTLARNIKASKRCSSDRRNNVSD